MYNIYHIHYRFDVINRVWYLVNIKQDTKDSDYTMAMITNESFQGIRRPLISMGDMEKITYNGKPVCTMSMFIGSINQYITIITEV